MATPNSTEPQILNPSTPMAFLPPDTAFKSQMASHIMVGTMGVIVWDILTNLSGDYRLLFKYRVGLPTIVYFSSRIAALLYVLISTLFTTAPIEHCQRYQVLIGILYALAVPLTSLLFFFRVIAVFHHQKFTIGVFFVLWLSVLAGCAPIATGVTAINLGPTKYCINFGLKDYTSAAGITALVHDGCVFFAISWRLLLNARVDHSMKNGVHVFYSGKYLPAFSRALLQDGQMYFMITVGSNILAVIMIYIPSVPVPYRVMFTVPNNALMNMMACRVFRNTKFGLIAQSYAPTGTATLTTMRSMLFFRGAAGRQDAMTADNEPTRVEITKTVDRVDDYPGPMESGTAKVPVGRI